MEWYILRLIIHTNSIPSYLYFQGQKEFHNRIKMSKNLYFNLLLDDHWLFCPSMYHEKQRKCSPSTADYRIDHRFYSAVILARIDWISWKININDAAHVFCMQFSWKRSTLGNESDQILGMSHFYHFEILLYFYFIVNIFKASNYCFGKCNMHIHLTEIIKWKIKFEQLKRKLFKENMLKKSLVLTYAALPH